jgi:hypothetical protein
MRTAQETIRRAGELGLRMEVRGPDRLGWKASRRPPEDFLAELRQHKAEIIAFLTRPSAERLTAVEATEAGGKFEIGKQLPVSASPGDGGKPRPWDTTDYRALFDERTAILQFEGGMILSVAEASAVEHCVTEWLNRHPSSSPAGHCVWCGKPEATGAAVVPFGVGERHIWLHPQCWPAWYQRRRADALAALGSFGIPVPMLPQPFERNTLAEQRYQAGLRIAAGESAELPSVEIS